MKILNFSPYNQAVNNNYQVKRNFRCNSLQQDTVSFSGNFWLNETDQNIQLYRSISESEYQKLISKKRINCGGYATSDKKGWEARDWQSGYVNNHGEPVYFVTFKIGTLPVTDRRDSDKDTRYSIGYSYDISNVKNIRKGRNVNGELVYSENFEEDKKQDIACKKQRINFCKNIILMSDDKETKEEMWDELASYANEFPEIVEEMEPNISFKSETDMNGILVVISNADKKEHIALYRKCIDACLSENMPLATYAMKYFAKYCERQDIPTIINMLNKEICTGGYAAIMLNKCAEDEDFEMIKSGLLTKKHDNLFALAEFCKKRNQGGKNTETIRDILLTINKIKKQPDYVGYRYSPTIETCAFELAKYGNLEDIPLLENFYNEKTPTFYPDQEVKMAINAIINSK